MVKKISFRKRKHEKTSPPLNMWKQSPHKTLIGVWSNAMSFENTLAVSYKAKQASPLRVSSCFPRHFLKGNESQSLYKCLFKNINRCFIHYSPKLELKKPCLPKLVTI